MCFLIFVSNLTYIKSFFIQKIHLAIIYCELGIRAKFLLKLEMNKELFSVYCCYVDGVVGPGHFFNFCYT